MPAIKPGARGSPAAGLSVSLLLQLPRARRRRGMHNFRFMLVGMF